MGEKKLADVSQLDAINEDVPCKIFVVGHYGALRRYYTVAQSREVAAFAYVAMLGAEGVDVLVSNVWVQDETGIQSMPLSYFNEYSVHNWMAEQPQRAKWIQAALKHLHPIITI